MLTVESQVLERHLAQLKGKSLLFAGAIRDQFPAQLQKQPSQAQIDVWSWYFDYVNQMPFKVNFELDYQPKAQLIIFYWGKNKQENQMQLLQLLSHCEQDQQVLIVGENRAGVKSAETFLQQYGDIGKIDSARRCSLYHFQLKQIPSFDLASYWKSYPYSSSKGLTIFSLPGVFSANELDQGTDLLLSSFEQPIQGKVLDIGCGAGIIGAYLKQNNPNIELTMVDIHQLALQSSQKTLAENQLAGEVLASDVFSELSQRKFNLIVSNPPFHDGIDTAYDAVNQLISQAKLHLHKGGELRIVANHHLPYPDLLDQHFGSHKVLVKSNKFKVYSVIAR